MFFQTTQAQAEVYQLQSAVSQYENLITEYKDQVQTYKKENNALGDRLQQQEKEAQKQMEKSSTENEKVICSHAFSKGRILLITSCLNPPN